MPSHRVILSLKFCPTGIISGISSFKQNNTTTSISSCKMVTGFVKLNCRDDVNFLDVLPGTALAEDLREPPL